MGAELELATDLRVHEQVTLAAHLMNHPIPSQDITDEVLNRLGLAGFQKSDNGLALHWAAAAGGSCQSASSPRPPSLDR